MDTASASVPNLFCAGGAIDAAETKPRVIPRNKIEKKRGNNMLEGGENVQVKITGPKGAVPVDLRDMKNGAYAVSYQLGSESGEYTISVTINGEDVVGSPFIQTVG